MTKTVKVKKTDEEVMPQAVLVEELQKHYGIEFNGNKEEFIRELTKESHKIVKEKSDHDPRLEAQFEEKTAKLRELWSDDLSEKGTPEQKELIAELKDKGYKVSVTFPDDDSYMIKAGGKEDSGTMSTGIPAIVGIVERLTNPQGY